jgi:hypothetical protein
VRRELQLLVRRRAAKKRVPQHLRDITLTFTDAFQLDGNRIDCLLDAFQDVGLAFAERRKLLSKRRDVGWKFDSAAQALQRSLSSGKPLCPEPEQHRE